MTFLPTRQVYINQQGETSKDYVSLLPKNLTLRPDYVSKRFSERRTTIFHEVNVVPLRDLLNAETRSVFHAKPSRHETQDKLLSGIRAELKRVVADNWKPAMFHVILHSSGIDSRLLSWTIQQLYQERGDAWLGKVVFLCSKWEGRAFKNIMRYEGWDESQYCVIRENVPKPYYYESTLDFENAWKRANGVSAIPVNLFWYPIEEAQKAGMIPKMDLQVWNSQWGNTALDYGSSSNSGERIKKTWKMFYWSMLFQRPMAGDEVVKPFSDCDLIKRVTTSKTILGHKLRPLLLRSMDEGLAAFTNMNADGDRHQRIADDIIARMIKNYNNSWYAKHTGKEMKLHHKTTEFQAAWSRYTAASLCEYLLQQGHIIR